MGFSDCNLTGTVPSFSAFTALVSINLADNNFDTYNIGTMRPSTRSIQQINFANNNFDQQNVDNILYDMWINRYLYEVRTGYALLNLTTPTGVVDMEVSDYIRYRHIILTGNTAPSVTGLQYKSELETLLWNVLVDE